MEFFIAFLGLIYWISRSIDEAIQHKRFEDRLEKSRRRYREINDSWKKEVIDTELEDELWKYVTFTLNYDKVWEEISPVLQMFPSLSKKKKLCFNSREAGNYYCLANKMALNAARIDRNIALRILLAKRGKVLREDVLFHISNDMLQRCDYDDYIDFLFWIKKQLESHGVSEELVIKSEGNYYYLNDNTRNMKGTIYWYPTVARIDNIRSNIED